MSDTVVIPSVDERVLGALAGALGRAITALPSDVGIANSGGVDSGLLHHLLRCRPDDASVAVTVGFPGQPDVRTIVPGPRDILIDLDDDLVLATLIEVRELTGLTSPVDLSFEIPILLAVRALPPGPVVVGQGADELFGGYARYADLAPEAMVEASRIDLVGVLNRSFPRELTLAEATGHRLVAPFLDPGFIAAVSGVEPATRFPPGNKGLLRALARHLGVPILTASRPKKAAQYGSGVMSAMRRIARRKGLTLNRLCTGHE